MIYFFYGKGSDVDYTASLFSAVIVTKIKMLIHLKFQSTFSEPGQIPVSTKCHSFSFYHTSSDFAC